MTKYSLYSARKFDTPPPADFAHEIIGEHFRWFLVEGRSTDENSARCDLVYRGHGMSHERCIAEIERLERSGGK